MLNTYLLTNVQVEMPGLTGHIAFDDDGLRKDYRLDVNELTVDSEVRKVSLFWPVLSL